MINPELTLEQFRDDIRSKTLTLFDQWDQVPAGERHDEMRKYLGGQIESFLYLMSSLDSDAFDLLSAERQRRLGVDNWTDEITDEP